MFQRFLRIDQIILLVAISFACHNALAQSQPMVPVTPKPGSAGPVYTATAQATSPPIIASGTQTNTQTNTQNTQGSDAWRAITPAGAGYRVAANPAGFYQQPAFDGFAAPNQPAFGVINNGYGYGAPAYQVAQVPQQYPQTAPVYVPQSYVAPGVQPYYGANPGGYGLNTFQPQWTAQLNYLYMTRKKSNSFPLLLNNAGMTKFDAEQLDYGWTGGFDFAMSRRTSPNSNFELRYFQIGDWTALGASDIVPGDSIATVPVSLIFFPGTIDYVANTNLRSFEANFVNRSLGSDRFRLAFGFRWISISENLLQTITSPGIDSVMDIDTNNYLWGFQIGSDGMLFNTGCFSVAGWLKAGVYANWADQSTRFGPVMGNPVIYSSAKDTVVSFMGELGLMADWAILPRVSIVAGYQWLYVAGAALAPDQLQNMTSIGTGLVPTVLDNSDPFYNGGLIGFDVHW